MNEKYEHQDFYLCSFLILNGIELINHYRENNLTTFVFEKSEKLMEHVNDYYSHIAATDALEFARAIRNLKAIIHTNRVASSSSTRKLNNESYQKSEGSIK